jgi:hypothetical protein
MVGGWIRSDGKKLQQTGHIETDVDYIVWSEASKIQQEKGYYT